MGWTEAGFIALVLGALGLRLKDLADRTMHYDEAIHLQAAWRLAEGHEYLHSAWMHGPFQIEYTALIFWIFGDTDFTARMGYALFGAALVGLPYFLKDHIGRTGALFTGVLLALSPAMLYFSRFGRNDIIMAFWAASLMVLMWRYFHEGRNRYLFMASAVLALMFATKETAYIVTLLFLGITFLLGLPDLAAFAFKRARLSELTGPAGFFLLMLTLTIPQWIPMFSLAQDSIGLVLASREGAGGGLVGAPLWAGRNLQIPLFAGPWWFEVFAPPLAVGALAWLAMRSRPSGSAGNRIRRLAPNIGAPVAVSVAAVFAILRPLSDWIGASTIDLAMGVVLAGVALAALAITKHPWRRSSLLILVPAALTAVYLVLFTEAIDVDQVVHWILPGSVKVNAGAGEIPVNYLVAGGLLLGGLALSIYLGVRWMGGLWLGIAGVFYVIWVTLYTTFFTNIAGIFSGVWQGMGYWIAQQDVARGNQPWYYYFVELSVYEFLPLVFGVAGAVYFVKKGNILGVVIALWAAANTLIYTITSEKMPWLLVNITLPFIFLAGIYLGNLANMIRWRRAAAQGAATILILAPVVAAVGFYLGYAALNQDHPFGPSQWGLLASICVVALAAAFLIRIATPREGLALAGLGMAGLLLGFGVWASFRAAYTFDDSNVEILVYAQGGADLQDTSNDLDRLVFNGDPLDAKVVVDYDVWYPFQWYVRHAQDDDALSFACFKGKSDEGWNDSCKRVSDAPEASARLLTLEHGDRDKEYLAQFVKRGPLQNLLWFPESYRRPGENRQDEGSFWGFRGVPGKEQFSKDLAFFRSSATSRKSWVQVMDYWLFRKLEREWYDSKYYSYLP